VTTTDELGQARSTDYFLIADQLTAAELDYVLRARLLGYHVARHMADMEALDTYEGTAEIQTLMVGRDITGVGAFA
jgi:alkylation response protein AidB-like acyl-CoA dehydrogenase